MKFYSTNHRSEPVSAREAIMQGLAPDGGLYMPSEIPSLSSCFDENLASFSFAELALAVGQSFLGNELPAAELRNIAEDLARIQPQLAVLTDKLYVLELFHGPTMAFKDYAARFMAKVMSSFNRGEQKELTILVATSGDTGSAVASGFFQVPGIKVIILYPSGKVTPLQEKQLTTLGENITALEIDGVFDDCQHLVKQAFVDSVLKQRLRLSSANSINIARLIPQSIYYLHAGACLKRMAGKNSLPVFSVPSGNFGNLTGGLLAKHMGLKVKHFIAATNANDTVVNYLHSGDYQPRPSVATLSNAMDVGNPSNFARMLELYNKDYRRMAKEVHSAAFSDEATKEAIAELFKKYAYLMDPHGAVGYLGWKDYVQKFKSQDCGILCETAHPGKFIEIMDSVLPGKVQIPERLAQVLTKEKQAQKLSKHFAEFKSYLLS